MRAQLGLDWTMIAKVLDKLSNEFIHGKEYALKYIMNKEIFKNDVEGALMYLKCKEIIWSSSESFSILRLELMLDDIKRKSNNS